MVADITCGFTVSQSSALGSFPVCNHIVHLQLSALDLAITISALTSSEVHIPASWKGRARAPHVQRDFCPDR